MKQQEKSAGQRRFSASALRDLQNAYRALERVVRPHPWLVQGTLNVVAPKSPSASVAYTWTRKVRAKTVTVSLSHPQATAFRKAIEVNRQVEAALSRLRQVSQAVLLAQMPGVTKRRRNGRQNAKARRVPK
jgi:hypothetical protein